MGLAFPLLIWDSLLTNSHEKRKAALTERPFWAILKPSGVTGNGRSLYDLLSHHHDDRDRLGASQAVTSFSHHDDVAGDIHRCQK